jgi:hypothetical protein
MASGNNIPLKLNAYCLTQAPDQGVLKNLSGLAVDRRGRLIAAKADLPRWLSWSRRSFVQDLVRQVGRGVDIMQRRDDFLTHEPDRAHQFVVLDPAKHHPVADVGSTDISGALELGNDGCRAAKEEPIPVGRLLQFAFVRSSIDSAIGDILPIQAALGPVLPARIRQRSVGFFVRRGDVCDAL